MSLLSAKFFSYVQGADFYRQLHEQAVALTGPGNGRTWFDVGCGPGLVARQAQAHGYSVTGFDLDAAMLEEARRRSASSGPRYLRSDLAGLASRHGQADVVSAASLLVVLPDRRAALAQLLDAVAPRGILLVVETGQAMSHRARRDLFMGRVHGKRAWVLRLWAGVRQGRPFVDVLDLCPPGFTVERHDLLGGLVHAWIVRREQATGSAESPGTETPGRAIGAAPSCGADPLE